MAKKITIMASPAGYDLAARDYDKKEKYLDSFEKDRLLSLLGNIKGRKILDAGAGTGRLALRLQKLGAEVTALDISGKMLAELNKKNTSIVTVAGDAEALPFEAETFDFVIAAFLIVHFKDPARFFDEAYRVLKDGGVLVVTNINQKEPPEIKTEEGTIKIESFYHRPEKIRQTLESLAFAIEHEEIVKEGGNWINQIIVAKK
jgi:ubiquinone/menaquinone biosynthesis C-methylase UbiE